MTQPRAKASATGGAGAPPNRGTGLVARGGPSPAGPSSEAAASLPSKLFFRIGEVAELVGVEPHVLRYWEREFRSVRPTKSAKGQRVYARRDVESLLRVRDLLYREGFTIAGARKKLQRSGEEPADQAPRAQHEAAASPGGDRPQYDRSAASPAGDRPQQDKSSRMREQLLSVRSEIEAFLAELG
jgi:DNA-binding transcriptional MerR regulator